MPPPRNDRPYLNPLTGDFDFPPATRRRTRESERISGPPRFASPSRTRMRRSGRIDFLDERRRNTEPPYWRLLPDELQDRILRMRSESRDAGLFDRLILEHHPLSNISIQYLDSLLQMPDLFRPENPNSPQEADVSREPKRRKIQHEKILLPPNNGFRYGHKGQVVPGRLKMQVQSCDGGEYPQGNSYNKYPVQNVLKTDKSVYCSEKSSCNLLLRHLGEMPFALEKVVIKAPNNGFSAPLQEGLIFVAMSDDGLLERTASYEIVYDPPYPPAREPSPQPPRSQSSDNEDMLSLTEALNDPYLERQRLEPRNWAQRHRENARRQLEGDTLDQREETFQRWQRQRELLLNHARSAGPRSSRHRFLRDDTPPEEDPPPFQTVLEQLEEETRADEVCEEPDAESYAEAIGVSAPTPPPFSFTTESEEESEENEDLTNDTVMADRLNRERRWREDSPSDEDYFAARFMNRLPGQWPGRNHVRLPPRRAARRVTPSRIVPKEPPDGEAPIVPNAKFFIAKDKSKISIRFHPALSGKFVLLKLWSPCRRGNIDIESIQCYGYSGPRFFPAVQPC
ncbi:hypothetical protein M011DRAFT_474590 [Sporormia fimetaria CBS 119925]|uniref:Uncharacterized protein n=1 Tax=Sporormia fimetaria CBS 119925 TaxID=1340428 RepID=A0A6A6VIY5_9PLEO|nr:hypothetical protein M011DRAFT_474590 [Sporormia fimetaria CBS 119925]